MPTREATNALETVIKQCEQWTDNEKRIIQQNQPRYMKSTRKTYKWQQNHKIHKAMNTLQQKNLFRLSAVLYAKTNDKISTKQIYRKIIEDALFCKGDSVTSVSALISYINSAYALLFSTREIEDVVTSPHNKNKFIYSYKNNEIHISLTEEYKNKLNHKSQDKNLVDFIGEFIGKKGYNNEIKEMILRFFYAVFTSNLNGFKRLLNEGTNGKILIKIKLFLI